MKRTISAVMLLIICIISCVCSSITVERKVQLLTGRLELLENELINSNYTEALDYITELENEWEKAEKIFSSLSETKLIDELNLSFNSLEKYIYANETGHAIIVIEECINGLETISQWQKITIDNIL